MYRPRPKADVFCKNVYCETAIGHTEIDCFSYGGGKVGQYPEGWRGRTDIHLSPEAKYAARRKQLAEGGGNRFAGFADYTFDEDSDVEEATTAGNVDKAFAYMLSIDGDDDSDEDDEDAIKPDEEVRVNAVICNMSAEQTNSTLHDTGATRHIFWDAKYFHDYKPFTVPIKVHTFGTDLSTQALGRGKILMKGTHEKEVQLFSIGNALHIPNARCNLISGSRMDKKRVGTNTPGNRTITYFSPDGKPFVSGRVINELFEMDVKLVENVAAGANSISVAAEEKSISDTAGAKPGTNPDPIPIAAMVLSVTSLFGPGNEDEISKKVGFSTV